MKRTSACKPWLEGVTMRGTDPLGQGSRVADALLEGKLREKGLPSIEGNERGSHARAFHSAACSGHKSLSGAGLWVQRAQTGASQVPERRVGTFQSHSRFAGWPHWTQRLRFSEVQTMARVPLGRVTLWQVIPQCLRKMMERSDCQHRAQVAQQSVAPVWAGHRMPSASRSPAAITREA